MLLDDLFPLRYWRDHDFGLRALWDNGVHNYLHYNPRLGEMILAMVDGSRAIHIALTPLVQLALLALTFVLAFGRWPRRTYRDLAALLVLQTMIWITVPIPGLMYFYRPYATNYLWGLTITVAAIAPYRLALANPPIAAPGRAWHVPIALLVGWMAGMCNEHTGPTAIVAALTFTFVAWRQRRLRAWMVGGLGGLAIGYAMLFFAPGQSVRYSGIAQQATPLALLHDRGVFGCARIVGELLYESRLGIVLFLAIVVRAALMLRGTGAWRRPHVPRAVLALLAASGMIVVTLFASPTTIDRVYFASCVLLASAFTVGIDAASELPGVRRFVVATSGVVFAYHVAGFVVSLREVKVENDARFEILAATPPGEIAVVPRYTHPDRSRWVFGDDLAHFPWFAEYVAGELYGLAGLDIDRRRQASPVTTWITRTYDPPLDGTARGQPIAITYRQLLEAPDPWQLASRDSAQPGRRLRRIEIRISGLFGDAPRNRPVLVFDGSPTSYVRVDGRPGDHVIHLRRSSLPAGIADLFVLGCGERSTVTPVDSGIDQIDLPIDERRCRGPFTAIACTRERCWVAGWY